MKPRTAHLSLGFLFGAVAASLLFAATNRQGQDLRRLKIAHTLPTNHPVHAGIENFAERVAAISGGRLRLDIFPNGQLGTETQTLEQIQAGTLDLVKVGGATLGDFVPVARVFSLPYLFRDETHNWAVLDGEIGREILDKLAFTAAGKPSGFRGLTYYDAGSRNFYARKPILSPDDLKGLKIRVMNDPVAIDMVQALGAAAAPISWGELYTALQQGVVDGAENNTPSFVSSRHFEVCKEFSFDHHTRVPDVVLVATLTWDRLSEEEKSWLEQASAESSVFQRKAWKEGVTAALEEMEKEGVTLREPDMKPFMEATELVLRKHATGELESLVERIRNVSAE